MPKTVGADAPHRDGDRSGSVFCVSVPPTEERVFMMMTFPLGSCVDIGPGGFYMLSETPVGRTDAWSHVRRSSIKSIRR